MSVTDRNTIAEAITWELIRGAGAPHGRLSGVDFVHVFVDGSPSKRSRCKALARIVFTGVDPVMAYAFDQADISAQVVIAWNAETWDKLEGTAQRAAVDHMLSHIGRNEKGELEQIAHAVEDFPGVIERNGIWQPAIGRLLEAAARSRGVQPELFSYRADDFRATADALAGAIVDEFRRRGADVSEGEHGPEITVSVSADDTEASDELPLTDDAPITVTVSSAAGMPALGRRRSKQTPDGMDSHAEMVEELAGHSVERRSSSMMACDDCGGRSFVHHAGGEVVCTDCGVVKIGPVGSDTGVVAVIDEDETP